MSEEKEPNQIKSNFNQIEDNIKNIESLINMLCIALDNDFAPPEIIEIQNYICIIQQQIETHKKLLKTFINTLSLPDNKAELILLRTTVFNSKDKN